MAHLKIAVVSAVLVLVIASDSFARSWRGITPLKSTRMDVEKRFGKPNVFGRYEVENERAYVFYSEEKCTGKYQHLAQEKCECLVPTGTVLRIAVTLERGVKFQPDKSHLNKSTLRSTVPKSTYSNLDEGVVYTVLDANGLLTGIDYWPSVADCQGVIAKQTAGLERNVWRGIQPLHSIRNDVEKILGPPKKQLLTETYIYETTEEQIRVLYSGEPCSGSVVGNWNVPLNTVLRMTIYPLGTILISDLQLNRDKYKRGPDANIPNAFYWVNSDEGIMIESVVRDRAERVVSITYSSSSADKGLECK